MQPLLEQVNVVEAFVRAGDGLERLLLALGEVLGVLGQRITAVLHRLLVERVGHPRDHVERIHHPLGASAVRDHDAGDQLGSVSGDDAYGGTLFLAQKIEESLQDLLAVSLRTSDDAAGIVVQDHGHVADAAERSPFRDDEDGIPHICPASGPIALLQIGIARCVVLVVPFAHPG